MSWATHLPLGRADAPTRNRVLLLADAIVSETGVSVQGMLGRSRRPRITAARHKLWAAMWLARFSHTEIAELVDRDHSTVIQGVTKALGRDVYKAELRSRRLAVAS